MGGPHILLKFLIYLIRIVFVTEYFFKKLGVVIDETPNTKILNNSFLHVVGSLILVNQSALQQYIFEWIKKLYQKLSAKTPAKLYEISQRQKCGLIQLRFMAIGGIFRNVFGI
jgi:hypothetical protein